MIFMNLVDFNLHASEQLNGYAIMKKSSSESKQNTLLAAGVLIQFAVQITFHSLILWLELWCSGNVHTYCS